MYKEVTILLDLLKLNMQNNPYVQGSNHALLLNEQFYD